MIALVLDVMAASIAAGSMLKVSSSMSANTGVAPVSATAFAVAAKLNDGTMTSSPRADAAREEGHVQGRGAGVEGDRVEAADELGELLLERGDLRALGEHAGLHDAIDGGALLGADLGLCCGDHAFSSISSRLSGATSR